MAASDKPSDESLYPIAVLIDELKNEDIQVSVLSHFSFSYTFFSMNQMNMATQFSWFSYYFHCQLIFRISQFMTHIKLSKQFAYAKHTQISTIWNVFVCV